MRGLTIADVEDAWLTGSTIFNEWLEEHNTAFMKPLTETIDSVALMTMPQEVIEKLEKLMPVEMAELKKHTKQGGIK